MKKEIKTPEYLGQEKAAFCDSPILGPVQVSTEAMLDRLNFHVYFHFEIEWNVHALSLELPAKMGLTCLFKNKVCSHLQTQPSN